MFFITLRITIDLHLYDSFLCAGFPFASVWIVLCFIVVFSSLVVSTGARTHAWNEVLEEEGDGDEGKHEQDDGEDDSSSRQELVVLCFNVTESYPLICFVDLIVVAGSINE